MADAVVGIKALAVSDGATVSAVVGAPISGTYSGTVFQGVASINIPEADLVVASVIPVTVTITDGAKSVSQSLTMRVDGAGGTTTPIDVEYLPPQFTSATTSSSAFYLPKFTHPGGDETWKYDLKITNSAVTNFDPGAAVSWPAEQWFEELELVAGVNTIQLLAWRIDGGTPQLVDTIDVTVTLSGAPELLNTAVIIDGGAHTFTWRDTSPPSGRTYQIYVDGLGKGLVTEPVTSQAVTGLPTDGTPVDVYLEWNDGAGAGQTTAVTFATSSATSPTPTITSPAPGSTLTGSTVTITWALNAAEAQQWYVRAGPSTAQQDLYFDSDRLTDAALRTIDVTGLPTDGGPVVIQLQNKTLAGPWETHTFSYTAQDTTTAGTLTVSNVIVSPTATGAQIQWQANGNAVDGYLEWWVGAGARTQTTAETSYLTAHSQTITGAPSSTVVNFEIFSYDTTPTRAPHTAGTFTTLAAAVAGDNTPTIIDHALITGKGYTLEWSDTPSNDDVGMPLLDYIETAHWSNGGPLLYKLERASTPNTVAICPLDGSPALRSVIKAGEADGILFQGVQLSDAGIAARGAFYTMDIYAPKPAQGGPLHPNSNGVGGLYFGWGPHAWSTPGTRLNPGGGTYYPNAVSFRLPVSPSNRIYCYSYNERRRLYWEQFFIDNPDSTQRPNGQSYQTTIALNDVNDDWVRLGLEVIRNNPAGASNGITRIYINGILRGEWTNVNHFGVGDMRPKGFGLFHQHTTKMVKPEEAVYIKNMALYVDRL